MMEARHKQEFVTKSNVHAALHVLFTLMESANGVNTAVKKILTYQCPHENYARLENMWMHLHTSAQHFPKNIRLTKTFKRL